MKRIATIASMLLAISTCCYLLELSRPAPVTAKASMPDAGLTGAPGQGSCVTCHSGALNDVNGTVQIFGVPAQYAPGQLYTLAVIVTRAIGSSRWGFELTSLTSGSQMAGTLNDNNPLVGKQTQGGITYVSQTTLKGSDGTYADSLGGAWFFEWTAPPMGTGSVTFYAAGAACNNNNAADAGDFTYTTSVSSAEGAPSAVESTTWGKLKMIYH